MLLVRAIRGELRPRLWQCHLQAVAPDGERRQRTVGPVEAATAEDAQRMVLEQLLAGRRLPPGSRITCRATWW